MTEENITEYILKLTGGTTIDTDLAVDSTMTIAGEITIFSSEKRSNNDGSYTKVMKGKFTGPIAIT